MKLAGTRDIGLLLHITVRGDWRARATALSTIGLIVRGDPLANRDFSIRNKLGGRLAWVRKALALAGPRGAFIGGPVVNRLQDNSWFVRFAAALALAEFRDPRHAPSLTNALTDHFRPVRIAAAAALCASGRTLSGSLSTLLTDCAPTPEKLGDSIATTACVIQIIKNHLESLEVLRTSGLLPDTVHGLEGWTRFLLGDEADASNGDTRAAERERYDETDDSPYLIVKPFTPLNRVQNLELLFSFSGLAMNLHVEPGGLVLDLGGGAAWVSELLSRFGFRPVTLDISDSLLRIGQKRLADARLPYRAIVGNMTTLPFRPSTLDAVVIIDALHHSPDLRSTLREVFRVLKPGGQFLFAEPGEGHGETEKSLIEMQEHGVREAEIHPAEVARYAREVGFDSVHVLPLVAPTVLLKPEELGRVALTAANHWIAERDGHPVRFDEFLTQSMLGHPAMVLTKGSREITSRAPRVLRAEIRPHLAREGRRVYGSVAVHNRGDTLWLKGDGGPGTVRLGVQLLTCERAMIALDHFRADLPRDVSQRTDCELVVDFQLPSEADPYVLKLDMVAEQVCWFSDSGSRPVYLRI